MIIRILLGMIFAGICITMFPYVLQFMVNGY